MVPGAGRMGRGNRSLPSPLCLGRVLLPLRLGLILPSLGFIGAPLSLDGSQRRAQRIRPAGRRGRTVGRGFGLRLRRVLLLLRGFDLRVQCIRLPLLRRRGIGKPRRVRPQRFGGSVGLVLIAAQGLRLHLDLPCQALHHQHPAQCLIRWRRYSQQGLSRIQRQALDQWQQRL